MRPTAKARSPLAIPTSFGRNGAPAAVHSNRRATRSGSSSQSSRATRMAPSGIRTKFASSASETTRPLRSGATTCPTVRLTPTASMLDTTNASIAADTALLSSVILGLLLQSGGRRVNVTRTVCVEMTMRYSHLAPAHNAAAVEKARRSSGTFDEAARASKPASHAASRSGPRANVRGLERNWNVLSGPQTPAKKKLVEEHRLRSGGGGNRTTWGKSTIPAADHLAIYRILQSRAPRPVRLTRRAPLIDASSHQ